MATESTHPAESVTLRWGEIPPWMEQVGTRGTITRNGIPTTRLGRWIGDEPVFVLRHTDGTVIQEPTE